MVHSEICAVPAERLMAERELLAWLPSLRARIGRHVTRKMDKLSCVRFASARYWVPTRLRTDDGRLLVIMTAHGEVVAGHTLVASGEASVRDGHYGGPRPDSPRRAVRPKTAAEKEFCALGPVAEAFITGAAAEGATRLPAELAASARETRSARATSTTVVSAGRRPAGRHAGPARPERDAR